MVCFKSRCIVMMSPFFVPGVLKLCDSAAVSTKNSSSSYGLPILRNQPNWCSNGGERIPMGSLFEITPCTYCVCKPGGYWDECRRQTCPNYNCDFFEFPSSDPCCPVCPIWLKSDCQFVVLVGIIITLAEFRIKYSEEKFKKCFIFFKLMQIIFELEENKMKKKLNQKKKINK